MLIPSLLVLAGLGILLVGGDIFVRGSASIAAKLKISALVIGLTVVAFGTSAPELIINIFSALSGSSDIALGNVLGSNISNILLGLGVAGVILPLSVKKGTAFKEIPFAILTVLVLFFLASDKLIGDGTSFGNMLSRADGFVLISFFFIFLYYTYGLTKVEGDQNQEKITTYSWPTSLLYILGGMICLFFGGKLLVDNAVLIARLAGLSELFIGLTITAIGTSLPEIITSAIAAYKNHPDLAIGNIVGSNIFNILWVLGLTPIIAPLPIQGDVTIDILITLGISILLFAILFVGGKRGKLKLRRSEAVGFILLYVVYIIYIVLRG
ncbi:MAG: calcium/sodium antiporter [Candidatus Magasanikbacteria bacterium]|jgi:cation:H+ antiporter|nr:calcium/sodium antiporter [Candidatus Magasanikbacteria bacterium]